MRSCASSLMRIAGERGNSTGDVDERTGVTLGRTTGRCLLHQGSVPSKDWRWGRGERTSELETESIDRLDPSVVTPRRVRRVLLWARRRLEKEVVPFSGARAP